jgi:hypothetical protein
VGQCRRAHGAGRQGGAGNWVKTGQRKLADNVAEFLLDEKPVLVRPHVVEDFSADVVRLRDDANGRPSGWPNWNRNWIALMPLFASADHPAGGDSYGLDELALRA